MSAYLAPIKTAVFLFPVLALFISLPFLIVQYRRYGSFIFSRALVLYSFVFYMLTAYFMVILPLPSREFVAQLTTQKMQLIPGNVIREFIAGSGIVPGDLHTWVGVIRRPAFLQPVFNVLLTVPFGFYLRYYFRKSWKQVALMGLGLSLFYELTQLSGLYFIYPRPYRLFDVDDLWLNTLGALIGYWLTPLLRLAFPNRDKMDARSYAAGQKVGWLRRLVAFFIDFAIVGGLIRFVAEALMQSLPLTASLRANVAYVIMVLIVFVIGGLDGRSVGKAIVRIRVVSADPARGHLVARRALRAVLLYYVCLPIWSAWWHQSNLVLVKVSARTDINLFVLAMLSVIVLFFVADIIWTLLHRDRRLFYDDWAHTMHESTVKQQTTTK